MAMSRAIQRRLAHGSNATLVTLMVIVLVGLLYGVAERNRVRFDLSEDGANRLLPDTERKIELIERSGEIVTVTAFTAHLLRYAAARELGPADRVTVTELVGRTEQDGWTLRSLLRAVALERANTGP